MLTRVTSSPRPRVPSLGEVLSMGLARSLYGIDPRMTCIPLSLRKCQSLDESRLLLVHGPEKAFLSQDCQRPSLYSGQASDRESLSRQPTAENTTHFTVVLATRQSCSLRLEFFRDHEVRTVNQVPRARSLEDHHRPPILAPHNELCSYTAFCPVELLGLCLAGAKLVANIHGLSCAPVDLGSWIPVQE